MKRITVSAWARDFSVSISQRNKITLYCHFWRKKNEWKVVPRRKYSCAKARPDIGQPGNFYPKIYSKHHHIITLYSRARGRIPEQWWCSLATSGFPEKREKSVKTKNLSRLNLCAKPEKSESASKHANCVVHRRKESKNKLYECVSVLCLEMAWCFYNSLLYFVVPSIIAHESLPLPCRHGCNSSWPRK